MCPPRFPLRHKCNASLFPYSCLPLSISSPPRSNNAFPVFHPLQLLPFIISITTRDINFHSPVLSSHLSLSPPPPSSPEDLFLLLSESFRLRSHFSRFLFQSFSFQSPQLLFLHSLFFSRRSPHFPHWIFTLFYLFTSTYHPFRFTLFLLLSLLLLNSPVPKVNVNGGTFSSNFGTLN